MSAQLHITAFSFTSVVLIMLLFSHCTIPGITVRKQPQPLQIITKEFPNGVRYYVMFKIPDYFPKDVPVYRKGTIEKLLVYGERDMDIIIKTSASFESVIKFYKNESERLGWEIETFLSDKKADNQRITIPLKYNNYLVETYEYRPVRGHIIEARRTNYYMKCRIVQLPGFQTTIIIQQVRTEPIAK